MKLSDFESDAGEYQLDGFDYEDATSLVVEGLLGFCGCGQPELAMTFIASGLAHIQSRTHEEWNATKADELRVFGSRGAAEFFYYWADKQDLTEHGGSVPGWLTKKGEDILAICQEAIEKP